MQTVPGEMRCSDSPRCLGKQLSKELIRKTRHDATVLNVQISLDANSQISLARLGLGAGLPFLHRSVSSRPIRRSLRRCWVQLRHPSWSRMPAAGPQGPSHSHLRGSGWMSRPGAGLLHANPCTRARDCVKVVSSPGMVAAWCPAPHHGLGPAWGIDAGWALIPFGCR